MLTFAAYNYQEKSNVNYAREITVTMILGHATIPTDRNESDSACYAVIPRRIYLEA